MAGTIPTYQRKVNTQDVPNVRVQANAPNLGAGMAKAVGNVADEQVKKDRERQNKIDIQKVLDTSTALDNDLMNAFYTKDTGFFDQKGTKAVGVAQNSNKFMTDTLKKYEDSLDNDNQRLVFKQHMIPKIESYNKMAMSHESQQIDAATDQSISDQMNSSVQGFVAARNNPTIAMTQLNAGMQTQELQFSRKGLTEESKKLQRSNYMAFAVTKAVEADLDENNVAGAQKTMSAFGDKLDPITKASLTAKIRPAEEKNELSNLSYNIKNDPAMLNSDGTLNLTKAEAAVEAKYGKTAVKPVGKDFDSQFSAFKQALIPVESGGDYNILGPVMADGDRAHGKYQIMESNWVSWSKEAGLGDNAAWTPENQDRVFEYKMKQYYDKFNGDWGKVAVAWQAGPDRADWSDDRLATISDGNMTPVEYRKAILSQMKQPAYDPTMYDKGMAEVRQAAAELQAVRSQNIKQQMDSFDNYLVSNKPRTVAEIEQAAKDYGFTGADLINAIGKGKQVAGLMKLEQNESSDDAYKQALQDIHDGKITSKADLGVKYGNSVHIDKLISLENFLDTTYNKESRVPSEIQNRDNWAAFMGVLDEMDVKDKLETSKVLEKVTIQVKAAKAKGESVSRSDIEQWTREQATQVTLINKPWYKLGDKKGIVGDVPPGWSIDSEGILDANGLRPDKYENGKFYITRNGQDYLMPGQGGD
jgi:hypothetical protein